jgi:hypothetical protein
MNGDTVNRAVHLVAAWKRHLGLCKKRRKQWCTLVAPLVFIVTPAAIVCGLLTVGAQNEAFALDSHRPSSHQLSGIPLQAITWVFFALSGAVILITFVITYFVAQHESRRESFEKQREAHFESILDLKVQQMIDQRSGEIVEGLRDEVNEAKGQLRSIRASIRTTAYEFINTDFNEPFETRMLHSEYTRVELWTKIGPHIAKAMSGQDAAQFLSLWEYFTKGQLALRQILSSDQAEIFSGLGFFWALAQDPRQLVPKNKLWKLIGLLNKQGRLEADNLIAVKKLGDIIGKSTRDWKS